MKHRYKLNSSSSMIPTRDLNLNQKHLPLHHTNASVSLTGAIIQYLDKEKVELYRISGINVLIREEEFTSQ